MMPSHSLKSQNLKVTMAILNKKQGSNRAHDDKFIPLALDSKGMPTEPILNKSKT